jgi:dTDP-4-amino-4,6-dideoxygalactose transaminase
MIPHSASALIASDFEFIQGIIERNFVGRGPLCADLQAHLMSNFACAEAILTDSGTAALHLSLHALRKRYPDRDRVLLSGYVCPEVVGAVIQAGLEPALADVREDSLNVDMNSIAQLVDARAMAVICTNIGGVPDDYVHAAQFGIPIISDCAQAIGSRIDGNDVAATGLFSILSFGSTKMVTAGGGGAVLCRDKELGRAIGILSRQELSVEEYLQAGFQSTFGQHMGELRAGLAAAQLRRLERTLKRRREVAEAYDHALESHADVTVVREGPLVKFNRFRYYFLTERAGSWTDHLRAAGIDARRSISHVIPEYFGELSNVPRLRHLSKMVVSVPISPAMTAAEVALVAETLGSAPGSSL